MRRSGSWRLPRWSGCPVTRFKVCGLKRAEDAVAAISEGASFIGLIFAPSKRQLTTEEARGILDAAREGREAGNQGPEAVGVFVNARADEINRTADYCGLDRIQLHGDETLEYCSDIERQVFKVVRIEAGMGGDELLMSLEEKLGAIVDAGHTPMLDTVSEGPYYGGTGQTFDWGLAAELAKKFDFVLSGGLNPKNVSQAIEEVGPWVVDVSSGVETGGVKDTQKIREFSRAVALADKAIREPA